MWERWKEIDGKRWIVYGKRLKELSIEIRNEAVITKAKWKSSCLAKLSRMQKSTIEGGGSQTERTNKGRPDIYDS